MERPPMFVNWWNSYCENGYAAENNLQIRYCACQNLNAIPHRNRKLNPKIHMETQKTLNSNLGVVTIPDFILCYRAITKIISN
jgi:hypothetical protein